MEEILTRALCKIIQQAGFEAINQKAMKYFISVFEDRIKSMFMVLVSKSVHSGRPTCSLIDLYKYIEEGRALGVIAKYSHNIPKTVTCANNRRNMFKLLDFSTEKYEKIVLHETEKWLSPLSNRVEKFIHIYDFMPDFPPIHTFRLTPIKQLVSKNLSSKVKNRLEQSLKSEKNMIKLIKSSDSLPKFINFLYENW